MNNKFFSFKVQYMFVFFEIMSCSKIERGKFFLIGVFSTSKAASKTPYHVVGIIPESHGIQSVF